ncbi:MAG: class I SAM-dependent methyltransferase [Goleter apudmare HA4340-LM2]|jgi:predicted O-methyltransferase YrrM|nr:class I SAM-dependent methyltransferase [Goleter apudmare HA4340-LM2]
MPVNYQNETFYSIEELSQPTNIPLEELKQFAVTAKKISISPREIQDAIHINKLELNKFFESFLSFKGIPSDRQHKIPDYLHNCTSAWAITLVEMYSKKINFPAAVSPEQGEFLKSIISNINPDNIVEIGCFTGISTIWMAAGLEQIGSKATIHAVDLFNEILPWLPHRYGYLSDPLEYARNSALSAGLGHKIKFHKMNSLEMSKRFNELINQPIDFLFIDGDHTKEGCMSDFVNFYPYVSTGGYIMLHDIYPEHCGWDGPRYVIDEWLIHNHNLSLVEIKTSPNNFGMALMRKIG